MIRFSSHALNLLLFLLGGGGGGEGATVAVPVPKGGVGVGDVVVSAAAFTSSGVGGVFGTSSGEIIGQRRGSRA